MKKLLLALAVASLSLTGCGSGGIDKDQMADIYKKVAEAAIAYCSFDPDFDSVADMVAAYDLNYASAVKSVGALSKYICKTVTEMSPRSAAPDSTPRWAVTINGKVVEITGEFK